MGCRNVTGHRPRTLVDAAGTARLDRRRVHLRPHAVRSQHCRGSGKHGHGAQLRQRVPALRVPLHLAHARVLRSFCRAHGEGVSRALAFLALPRRIRDGIHAGPAGLGTHVARVVQTPEFISRGELPDHSLRVCRDAAHRSAFLQQLRSGPRRGADLFSCAGED